MEVFIAAARRTPIGAFQGVFRDVPAPELGGAAIAAACADCGMDPASVDEVLMGNVLSAGIGQAPARQAAVKARLPYYVPATTISKVCGSGLRAVIAGYDQIGAGSSQIVVAGGMENMSRAPYLNMSNRGGARLGHVQLLDHMMRDGLEDAYELGRSMGSCAEICAAEGGFTREMQDGYAARSNEKTRQAVADGAFVAEICPVAVPGRKGEVLIAQDEQPGIARKVGIETLRPAFAKNGTITAGNASTLSDGAAAFVLGSEDALTRAGAGKLGRIAGYAGHAQEPVRFSTAPAPAVKKLLARLGWHANDIDLWEVNEAFAVVGLAFIAELDLDPARVNVGGGAVALGHPIGASGARILVTLLHAMEARDLKRGVAAICIGGGEALAIAITRA